MCGISLERVALVRFGASDLEIARNFLLDLGLIDAEGAQESIAMQGSDDPSGIYLVEKGLPGFRGIGLCASF